MTTTCMRMLPLLRFTQFHSFLVLNTLEVLVKAFHGAISTESKYVEG